MEHCSYPEDLLDRADKIVKHESLGFSSWAEFIKEAVKLRLEEVEKKLRKREINLWITVQTETEHTSLTAKTENIVGNIHNRLIFSFSLHFQV